MPIYEGSPYERLDELLSGSAGESIRSLDTDMRRAEPISTTIILTSNSSNLTRIASNITDTDRELRRTVVIIGPQPRSSDYYYFLRESGRPPRPIHPTYGGLLVRDASPGSLHLLTEAYGDVLTLLLSQPVTALVALSTLGQTYASLRVWLRRKRRVDLDEQPLTALTEAGGDVSRMLQGPPDQRLGIHPIEGDEGPFVTQGDAEPEPSVRPVSEFQSDEFYVRGRKITIIRNSPDGTQDIIHVES
jgi:hypothetical protein